MTKNKAPAEVLTPQKKVQNPPLPTKKPRKNYTEIELEAIDECVNSKGNVRKLAMDLGRHYISLNRFIKKRGGVGGRKAKEHEKRAKSRRIHESFATLFDKRKIRCVTATSVARASGSHRTKVMQVLGDKLNWRKNAAHRDFWPKLSKS